MHKRIHTTKLPSQIDKGDMIMLAGDKPHAYKLATVLEQPVKPERGEPWILKTDREPRGFSAPPTLRIPIYLDENPCVPA
jgi:hypothetical protein